MEETGQNPVILPPQVIEKPTSVTVFGILNIVFGGLGLLCMPFVVFGFLYADRFVQVEITFADKIWSLFGFIVGFGFSIWQLTLGIGLLTLRSWARRGTIGYAYADIVWTLLGVGWNILALYLGWTTPMEGGLTAYIGGTCGVLFSLIYCVLLLIFMQTTKVKRAFSASI